MFTSLLAMIFLRRLVKTAHFHASNFEVLIVVIPKLFVLAHHLEVLYSLRVPPIFRKSQKYTKKVEDGLAHAPLRTLSRTISGTPITVWKPLAYGNHHKYNLHWLLLRHKKKILICIQD